MFSIGDKIVHPMHGAGVVDSIVKQKVDGMVRQYYVIKMPIGNMLVMVPTDNTEGIGVRPVIDSSRATELIESLSGIEIELTPNWNKRYRENMLRIKSGDLTEVAKVIKGLMSRERQRGLSTGERKMLHSAKQILISELVLAMNDQSYEEMEKLITNEMA